MNRPVRKAVASPKPTQQPLFEKKPADPRPPCPTCGAPAPSIQSVVGGSKVTTLKMTWVCQGCGEWFNTERERKDVCEHGTVLFVPCSPCGRTWDAIFEGPNYRPEFHPRGELSGTKR